MVVASTLAGAQAVVYESGLEIPAGQLPPPYQFVDWDLLDKYRVWFADSPDKPAGKAPWASEARLYRPGGPPRFGTSR